MTRKKTATKTAKKIARGRPKKPDDERRNLFTLRLTEAEKELVEAAAAKLANPSRVWCRETLLAQARKVLGE